MAGGESMPAPGQTPDSAGHVARLRRYYRDTSPDYRLLWLNPRTAAMHFGYGLRGLGGHARSLFALNQLMAGAISLRSKERVLDAGCGVGGTSLWLAETHDADVFGINLVEEHVEQARDYARKRGLSDRVRFEVADYISSGLEDARFDVVWAQESACHAVSKPAFTQEAHRLLRPGGRLVMAEYLVTGEGSNDMTVWQDAWEMHLESAAGWKAALIATGFEDVQIRDITPGMRGSLRRLAWLCRLLGPGAGILRLMGMRTRAQQRNIAGSLAMWRALQRGQWAYGLVTCRRPAEGG